jgi:hypothetical protein
VNTVKFSVGQVRNEAKAFQIHRTVSFNQRSWEA